VTDPRPVLDPYALPEQILKREHGGFEQTVRWRVIPPESVHETEHDPAAGTTPE